jgi:hypothetical protein
LTRPERLLSKVTHEQSDQALEECAWFSELHEGLKAKVLKVAQDMCSNASAGAPAAAIVVDDPDELHYAEFSDGDGLRSNVIHHSSSPEIDLKIL